jgi:hypothetical protein
MADFVKQLEYAASNDSPADDALEFKDNHIPERLYRYRPDTIYARENLQNDTVWLCSPDDYNDPFDCRYRLSLSFLDEYLLRMLLFRGLAQITNQPEDFALPPNGTSFEAMMHRRLSDLFKTFPGTHADKTRHLYEYAAFHSPEFALEAQQKIAAFRSLTKVCSFSERADSILMWSHYAKDHKGFCVEYDLQSIPVDHRFRRAMFPVIYSRKLYDVTPLLIDSFQRPDGLENSVYPMLGFIHKANVWEYEREWRLLFTTSSPEPNQSWLAPTPSRIYLGACMQEPAISELTAIARDKNIETCKMRLAEGSFTVRPER